MATSADRSESIPAVLARAAARAQTMGPDARAYWPRHERRFEFVLRYLQAHTPPGPRRVLDVGPSFETAMLAAVFPDWQIDTLGDGRDERFVLPPPSRHFTFDLHAAADPPRWPDLGARYDTIVFMEVLEHLNVPPRAVLEFLGAQLADGGELLLTTPNAAWLKNRLKLLRGRNPFETLRPGGGGHIRESTLAELRTAAQEAGLECVAAKHCGLYGFTGAKDRFYDALANATLPALRRSLFLILRRPALKR
jgi:SAM-dependent methyltransferase